MRQGLTNDPTRHPPRSPRSTPRRSSGTPASLSAGAVSERETRRRLRGTTDADGHDVHAQLPAMDGNAFVICPLCSERIGVYEPMIVITAYGARRTSRAREPMAQGGNILLHDACYGIEPYERGENG
jgi:hypothetical protein